MDPIDPIRPRRPAIAPIDTASLKVLRVERERRKAGDEDGERDQRRRDSGRPRGSEADDDRTAPASPSVVIDAEMLGRASRRGEEPEPPVGASPHGEEPEPPLGEASRRGEEPEPPRGASTPRSSGEAAVESAQTPRHIDLSV